MKSQNKRDNDIAYEEVVDAADQIRWNGVRTFTADHFKVALLALVLQRDNDNKMYIAKTILDLESGYQDARLIAKPDESWLNPVTLK